MSSMQKLKAYFGLADDEHDGYDESYDDRSYGDLSYDEASSGAEYHAPSRRIESHVHPEDTHHGARGQSERSARVESPRPVSVRAGAVRVGADSATARDTDRRGFVQGSLAVDEHSETQRRTNPFHEDGHPLGTISTLHPRTYNEARTIGERYREGNPVIMNLTEMSDSDAKRLVDFAAGLAFALRGAIDKVTSKVFLLSPPDVDVSAEDRRRIAETGFYRQR